MKLYIFRHGMTKQTKENLAYTPADFKTSPILEEGKPSLVKLAGYLKNIQTDANYTSPIERCIQTVEIVSEISGKNFFPNEMLTEYAEWQESFVSLRDRAQNFIEYLEQQKIESSAVCTHGGVISALKYLLINKSYELSNLTDYPPPGVLTIIDGDKLEELDFN